MNSRKKFRKMLSEPGIEIQPSLYDPLTARLAEKCGFNMVALGGYAMGAHTAITEPLMSLEDVAHITRSVALVSNLPVMVDGGAGWGDPLHVMHTIKVLEQAGAASIHIEDQYFPKRARYHMGVEEIISMEEMVKKIHAAANARQDPDFAIVARTDAMRTHGYAEGVRRANEYVKAGADLIMLFPDNEEQTMAAPRASSVIETIALPP